MKKLLFILLCLPIIGFGKDIDDTDCQFKYKIQLNKYSGLFMCPYLGPKMITELNKINVCNLNKDEENQIVIFELDSLYKQEDIKNIFLKTIGIPEWSIDYIKLEE
ncbi:hypothetical protein OAJ65_02545 [Flavobacteriales bacterium]|nr:hypothetical protein [Flavobacteriales bacterium]